MRDDVRRDWDWANNYWAEQKSILLRHLAIKASDVRVGTADEDLHRGTDAVIYTTRGTVGLRTRDAGVWQRDFSIRSRRVGSLTELDKWRRGDRPDWFLISWARDATSLADWALIDVEKLLASGLLDVAEEKANHDGRTWAKYLPLWQLDTAGCLVARAPRPRGTRDPGEPVPRAPEEAPRLFG